MGGEAQNRNRRQQRRPVEAQLRRFKKSGHVVGRRRRGSSHASLDRLAGFDADRDGPEKAQQFPVVAIAPRWMRVPEECSLETKPV